MNGITRRQSCGAGGSGSAPSAPQQLAGKVRFLHPPDQTYVGPLAKVTDQFQKDNPDVQMQNDVARDKK